MMSSLADLKECHSTACELADKLLTIHLAIENIEDESHDNDIFEGHIKIREIMTDLNKTLLSTMTLTHNETQMTYHNP
jgi:hypothetical protein